MLKLPDKKYEPKHNDELKYYAQGWNSAIESVEYWFNKHGIEYTKKCLLNNKKYYLKRKEKPYFKGWYDCIVEIALYEILEKIF